MQKVFGWSESGGVSVVISGTQGSGSQRFQQSFRGCTITVYLAGTTTLVSIYSDNLAIPTAKANPFTADVTTGLWSFYAPNGRYDIKFSGGGLGAPFTLGDFLLNDPIPLYIDASDSRYSGGIFGSDPTAALQAAINSIATNSGAEVRIPSGTFSMTAAILMASRQVNLVGSGRDATILVFPAGVDGLLPSSGCRIAHMTVRGPNTASAGNSMIDSGSANDVVIEDCIIEKSGDMGINTGALSLRWKILNNIIRNNTNNGVFLASVAGNLSSDHLVEGNTILSNGANGVDMNCSRNLIKNNVIRLNGGAGGGVDQWGILIQALTGSNADYNTITGNLVSSTGAQGIIVRATAGQTSNYTNITGNTVIAGVGGNADGITLDGTAAGTIQGTAIVGNVVQGNAEHGILLNGASAGVIRNTTVTGNNVQGNTDRGIYIIGANCFDTVCSANVSMNNGTQIDTSGSIRTILADNKTNQTAFGYCSGPDTAGGNFWVLRDLTANANRIYISSAGLVSIPSLDAVSAFTVGSGASITKLLAAGASLNFPNTAAQDYSDLTIAVPGAVDQDPVFIGTAATGFPPGSFTAWVSAADTVTVRYLNLTAIAQNPAALNFKVIVMHV